MIELKLRCKKHPRYKAKRQPRAICMECNYIWAIMGEARDMDVLAKE